MLLGYGYLDLFGNIVSPQNTEKIGGGYLVPLEILYDLSKKIKEDRSNKIESI